LVICQAALAGKISIYCLTVRTSNRPLWGSNANTGNHNRRRDARVVCKWSKSVGKIAAAKAQCAREATPVAQAQCLNDAERHDFAAKDPYPDLTNLVFSARIKYATKVQNKEMTPEDAEFEFNKVVAQVRSEEQRRLAGAAAVGNTGYNPGAALQNAGAALQGVNAGAPPAPTICRPIGGGAISCQ
jgi:hypothetical protein